MILNRLKILIAEKEMREKRKLPYRTIALETGVSTTTITAYAQQKVFRFDSQTIEAFCKYFSCQPGDLLIWDKEDPFFLFNTDIPIDYSRKHQKYNEELEKEVDRMNQERAEWEESQRKKKDNPGNKSH